MTPIRAFLTSLACTIVCARSEMSRSPLPVLFVCSKKRSYFCGSRLLAQPNPDNSGRNSDNDDSLSVRRAYSIAKDLRTIEGHDEAMPVYKELLRKYPADQSAASHIAASPNAVAQQDSIFQNLGHDNVKSDVNLLGKLLRESNFTAETTHGTFCGQRSDREQRILQCSATGPVYIKPVVAGNFKQGMIAPELGSRDLKEILTQDNPKLANNESSRVCLINLFLLGFSVPRNVLEKYLLGEKDSVTMLERLGLICVSDHDASLMVPYISLFPLDVRKPVVCAKDGKRDGENTGKGAIWNHLVLATDWHPTVLSSIAVGKEEDGAVMYIGPDSLALVAHWPIILDSLLHSPQRLPDKIDILDICCGSGVQAISLLVQLKAAGIEKCRATCVDINPRALRFSKFNALLNGIDDGSFETCCTDISASNFTTTSMGKDFDFILANPPFIPVPQEGLPSLSEPYIEPANSRDENTISRRYGLFSSGGASGEEVLKSILRLSPRLLSSNPYAVVAIVSEFMNPGPVLTQNIKAWWKDTSIKSKAISDGDAIGLLVTNEAPVTAEVYASRRAGGDEEEYKQWRTHLAWEDIESVSPGMLLMGRRDHDQTGRTDMTINHALLPKGLWGSVWTPHNNDAIKFALKHWIQNDR